MKKEVEVILDTLLRPLYFASKNSFSTLQNIKDLEVFYKNLCETAISLPIPKEMAERLKELKGLFIGFDDLSLSSKKECILKGLRIIESIKSSSVSTIGGSLQSVREGEACSFEPFLSFKEVKERLEILSTPIERIDGVGKRIAERLKKKGLKTVEDILHFLPIRYEDRRRLKGIRELRVGEREVFSGEVLLTGEVSYGRKKVFEVVIGDGSGIIKAKWFNYNPKVMAKRFKKGERLILYGEIKGFGLQKEVHHPEIEVLKEGERSDSLHFNSIVPIYSQIEGIHQKQLRRIIKGVVERYANSAIGIVPARIKKSHNLMELTSAIKEIHFPSSMEGIESRNWLPRKTLIFEELFSLEVGLAMRKRESSLERGISFNTASSLVKRLKEHLPFNLTPAQERVLKDIERDMASPHQMNRLIQGDVGSGKTILAFMAALIAIENGYQVAIMAPTEILAEQHYRNSKVFLEGFGISIGLITSKLTKSQKEEALYNIRSGRTDLVIGTHALIQGGVEFKSLGLVIIDEQHRFGVIQRAALRQKGVSPDCLVMTATPIPRTLAMTVFGDLDVSIIDELPPGRQPIVTKIFRERDRKDVYDIIAREVSSGRQAYIVYPLVEESEELDLKDATRMAEYLKGCVFPGYSIGLIHGRLKPMEKDAIMDGFKRGAIKILVTTTVVEVGIDVPNATVMVIEHAERFGLAQLHQLRGRVGRGEHPSYCLLLVYKVGSEDTYKRLKVMETTQNGFVIAEEDLKLRGPGDFLGTRQSGIPDLIHANLIEDCSLLQKAREAAFDFVNDDFYTSSNETNRAIKEIVRLRWKGKLELAGVG